MNKLLVISLLILVAVSKRVHKQEEDPFVQCVVQNCAEQFTACYGTDSEVTTECQSHFEGCMNGFDENAPESEQKQQVDQLLKCLHEDPQGAAYFECIMNNCADFAELFKRMQIAKHRLNHKK